MGLTHAPKIVTDGLVLCLDPANPQSYPKSGTDFNALDKIGGKGVLYNNPTFDPDDARGCFNFDGASDYIRVTRDDLNAGSNDYTQLSCSLWFKPPASSSNGQKNLITVESAWEIATNTPNEYGYPVEYASNPWSWRNGGAWADRPKADKWSMITLVNGNSGRVVYVNDYVFYTKNETGNIGPGGSSYPYLTIGGRYGGTGSPYNGKIGCINIYNRELTAEEVAQNYNAAKRRYR